MSNENINRPGQMSLQALIAVIFAPMGVVFLVLVYLAQEYGFFRGNPLAFITTGLGISVFISVLLGVAYARFEPVRKGAAVARRILDGASQAFSAYVRSKWGFRVVGICLFAAMMVSYWLTTRSTLSVCIFAFNTLLFLCIVALLIDRRTAPARGILPTTHIDTFHHGLTRWEAEDLGRAGVHQGVGVPPSCLELFPVHDVPSLKYVLACRAIPEFRHGTIECDVRLTPNSLLNILFMADIRGRQFYMARLDSRPGCDDSFLEMEPHYTWWEYRAKSGTVTPAGQWVHVRLEVGSTSALLYRDNDELLRIALSDFQHRPAGYQIGLFSEVEPVFVDNFAVTVA